MSTKTLTIMAAAMSHLTNAFSGGSVFSGNKKCPNCGKPTMTGPVCDLRCAVALKKKGEVKP